jgi:serine/threonine-protein kinase
MWVGRRFGPFEIEKELGSGAMGMVYRAKWFKTEDDVRTVAFKVVALGLVGNESAMARFEREASILKQLRHPHIVRLYAHGKAQKAPFIAMEFVDGEALDRVLARRGRLGWEEIAAYGKQLAEALHYAHEQGIIHRDLKPSNLMITREGILKLTDFGIAKDTDVTALTGMNSTIGTAAYMSPEQCKGDKNHKSDLYSLGIVFFELLTGRKPFTAETTVDMFLKHVNEEPPRIGKLVENLPPKFAALILQLLEKDKDDRPQDAAWISRMLGEIIEDDANRKSAGLDAANARRGDRRKSEGSSDIDDEDREAARLLKGLTKKKKKKKVVPLFEQARVKAAGIVFALLILVAVAYFGFIKAPSANKLYTAIEEAKTPETRFVASEEYLKRYGEKPGDQTDKAASVFREETVRKREAQLLKRHSLPKMKENPEDDDPVAYKAAMDAIDLEKQGQLKAATEKWGVVKATFPEEAKLAFTLDDEKLKRAKWGWVAEKRLRDLDEVKATLARIRKAIEEIRDYETVPKTDASDLEAQSIRALRLGQFPDFDKSNRTWDSIVAQAENKPELRIWVLLAAEQKASQKGEPPEVTSANRPKRIADKLTQAELLVEQWKADPNAKVARKQARQFSREVIDLYDDDEKGRDQLTDAVNRAKQILASTG